MIALDQHEIERQLDAKLIDQIEIFQTIDSTNTHLLKQAQCGAGIRICLAEEQTAGRGRLNRQWLSPAHANIYMSILYPIEGDLSGLSLVAGLSVAKALHYPDIKLKWPNDVIWHDRKLGGILIETKSGCAVIGIGLNINMPHDINVDQPWVDLAEINQNSSFPRKRESSSNDQNLNRNRIVAAMINQLLQDLDWFQRNTFSAFQNDWNQYDSLLNKEIELAANEKIVMGVARGISARGELCLQTNQGLQTFVCGEAQVKKTRLK